MEKIKILKRLYFLLVFLCILVGFLAKHDHAVFFWHKIPSIDAIFGALGAILLLVAKKIVHFFTFREENFYD